MTTQSAIILEIRAAEGGDDAKLLVEDQVGIYLRTCVQKTLTPELLHQAPGIAVLRVQGKGAETLLKEGGGHRWQRVPPTEKRGRVHTSTITVVAYPEVTPQEFFLDPKDLQESFTRGGGPGGQHRNKVETAVVLKHLPTGITVRVEDGKSQAGNRDKAVALLRAKLKNIQDTQAREALGSLRKSQAGTGQRGDKVRTIQTQNDRVTNHLTGKTCSVRDYLKGRGIDLLW